MSNLNSDKVMSERIPRVYHFINFLLIYHWIVAFFFFLNDFVSVPFIGQRRGMGVNMFLSVIFCLWERCM